VPKNLDEIDLRILAEIQADGRITNVELAKRVGISPPPCLRRVRTLEDAGYILGYRGLLDPRRLGFDVTVFASVHLSSQADADLRAGMLDAVGRGRLHPEMRGARHGDVSGFRHPSDRSAPCPQRQDVAGAAQFEIRGRGAAGFEGGDLELNRF
jgi:Winged helix-turn-helix DNA-binding